MSDTDAVNKRYVDNLLGSLSGEVPNVDHIEYFKLTNTSGEYGIIAEQEYANATYTYPVGWFTRINGSGAEISTPLPSGYYLSAFQISAFDLQNGQLPTELDLDHLIYKKDPESSDEYSYWLLRLGKGNNPICTERIFFTSALFSHWNQGRQLYFNTDSYAVVQNPVMLTSSDDEAASFPFTRCWNLRFGFDKVILTADQIAAAVAQKTQVTCSGNAPALSDFSGVSVGKSGVASTADGGQFYYTKTANGVYVVEMGKL